MGKDKKEVRKRFRDAVFDRDGYQCQLCAAKAVELDAHHITNRKQMPNGGYVKENGITVCLPCHERVEAAWHRYDAGELPEAALLHPTHLYELVGSSYAQAVKASRMELGNDQD
jgi:hypothetical protein